MKLRRHNKSAIGLSDANPARGHKEVPRSMGYHSDNTLLNPIGDPIRDKLQELQFLSSCVLLIFQNLNSKLQRRLSDVLPCLKILLNKVIKNNLKHFLAIVGL